MEELRWGMIGTSDVAEVNGAIGFNDIENSQLEGVMANNKTWTKKYARLHKANKHYHEADEILNDPNINAIYIAVSPELIDQYAISALKKGLPVYLEKPIALNVAQARKMADSILKYDGRLTVANHLRKQPLILKVKELLNERFIGDIRSVQMRLWKSENPHQNDPTKNRRLRKPIKYKPGHFHDLSIQQLDLMIYLFGNPIDYRGYSFRQDSTHLLPDHIVGQIVFDNYITYSGSWMFNASHRDNVDVCEIIGSKGIIKFAVFGTYIKVVNDAGEQLLNFSDLEKQNSTTIYSVAEYFRGRGYNPYSMFDAIKALSISERFLGG